MKKLLVGVLLIACVYCAVDRSDTAVESSISAPANFLQVSQTNAFERNAVSHIVRTTDKKAHLVYTDREGSATQIFYTHSGDNGRSWSSPQQLSGGFNNAQEPLIINDSTDKLYVFWANDGSIYVLESIDEGLTWSRPFKVSGKFSEGHAPAAVIVDSGDIHLVWENAGNILYRSYDKQSSTWSTIYDISKSLEASTDPIITCFKNNYIYAAWLQQGEVVCRQMDLSNNVWGPLEQVSQDANKRMQTSPGACSLPLIVADNNEVVHIVWVNKNQVLHRVRVKGFWSPIISRLSNKYYKGPSQLSAAYDSSGNFYVAYIENNTVVVNQFNVQQMLWEKSKRIAPHKNLLFFSVQLGGSYSVNGYLLNYLQGYDLAWVEKQAQEERGRIVFSPKAVLPEETSAPGITSVANDSGYPFLTWTAADDQSGVQIIINNRDKPQEPVLYDSKKLDIKTNSYIVKDFNLKTLGMYFFVRTINLKGQWSEWSKPFRYQAPEDTEGPELEVTGIDEDSLYLYSPEPTVLYYGPGLEEAKTFVIRGKAEDKSSGISKIVFSPALGDAPPPLFNPTSPEWSVRYSIKSTDEPTTIIITAYDNAGHSVSKIVSVVKDITPPSPPAWVKIYPDKLQVDETSVMGNLKTDNDRQVYVTWVDGKDEQSGIRYQLMGNKAKWWQNAVHKSGDSEEGDEGLNTFYVFAVDNVGNVSEAGTDRIFIDSIPPDQPGITSTVTSGDYFYGTKTADTVTILVNGAKDPDMEMVSSANWRYKHRMHDGQKDLFQFQAVDALNNKSQVLEVRLSVDKTPPRLYYAEHNAEDVVLRVKDKLVVTAKGDPGNIGSFRIDNLTGEIPMCDDGTRGDIKANDGIYTGIYYVDTELKTGKADVIVSLFDEVGNKSEKKTLKPITIDSSRPIKIDDFEDKGDSYPWKNHAEALNISAADHDYSDLQIPEGKGCLKLDYDFQGQQNWAGISSRDFLPKNLFGSRAYLTFWLKGSGSAKARLFIYLQGKTKQDIVLTQKDIGLNYSVSLANKGWQKVSVPIADEYLDDLAEFTKYYVYVFGDNDQEKGTVYLDDLNIIYRIEGELSTFPFLKATQRGADYKYLAKSPVVVTNPASLPIMPATPANGEFSPAPYLQVQLNPQPAIRGEKLAVRITMPDNIDAELVYVQWGRLNNELQKTKLASKDSVNWRGEYLVPNSFVEGEHFGVVYIKTKTDRLFKKQFVFKVLDKGNNSPYERITALFYPHPVLPDTDFTVKVRIPAAVKSGQVMLFLGEDQQKIYSVNLTKETTSAEGIETWKGLANLPGVIGTGEYTANIFIKTKDNRFIKKKTIYAVLPR